MIRRRSGFGRDFSRSKLDSERSVGKYHRDHSRLEELRLRLGVGSIRRHRTTELLALHHLRFPQNRHERLLEPPTPVTERPTRGSSRAVDPPHRATAATPRLPRIPSSALQDGGGSKVAVPQWGQQRRLASRDWRGIGLIVPCWRADNSRSHGKQDFCLSSRAPA